jgi:polyferredoxin
MIVDLAHSCRGLYCGWICPLGSVQEWVGKPGKRVLRSYYNKVPVLLDRILKFGKNLMLLVVIIQTARTATLLSAILISITISSTDGQTKSLSLAILKLSLRSGLPS